MFFSFYDLLKRAVFDIDKTWNAGVELQEYRIFSMPSFVKNIINGQQVCLFSDLPRLVFIAKCAISVESGIPMERIVTAKIDEGEWSKLSESVKILQGKLNCISLDVGQLIGSGDGNSFSSDQNLDSRVGIIDSSYKEIFDKNPMKLRFSESKIYYRNFIDPENVLVRKDVSDLIRCGDYSAWLKAALSSAEGYSRELLLKEVGILTEWIKAGRSIL